MKCRSIWSFFKQKVVCPSLDKDIEVDVLIIGGGLTGISAAYHLRNSKLKVCVVEKNEVGSGVTSRTTGKLTYLQENIYSKIKNYHGIKKAKLYLESQKEAINIVKKNIEDNKIKCDFEKVDSYLFTNDKVDKLTKEIELLKEFNVDIKETNVLPNNDKFKKVCFVDDTYVFHPLKYLFSLKNICLKSGVDIYENTRVLSINKEHEYFLSKTDHNVVKSKYIIFALHYPYFLIPFWMPLKGYIEKSYIEVFNVPNNLKYSSINISKPIVSIRYHSDNNINYQLFLTNSHNAAVKENTHENFKKLLNNESASPDFIWSNKDIMTSDSLPFIGSINKEGTMLIGTGYNTWGMTNASLAGKILADLVMNQENKYTMLFNPLRKLNKGKVVNFPIVLGSNAYSFIKSKVKRNKSWYSSNIRFENRNGKSVAIYTDENKKEHIVYTLCPHLKCGLTFNEIEKTWDCPCHGSRFDIDGNSIEGPSNYDIKYKE